MGGLLAAHQQELTTSALVLVRVAEVKAMVVPGAPAAKQFYLVPEAAPVGENQQRTLMPAEVSAGSAAILVLLAQLRRRVLRPVPHLQPEQMARPVNLAVVVLAAAAAVRVPLLLAQEA